MGAGLNSVVHRVWAWLGRRRDNLEGRQGAPGGWHLEGRRADGTHRPRQRLHAALERHLELLDSLARRCQLGRLFGFELPPTLGQLAIAGSAQLIGTRARVGFDLGRQLDEVRFAPGD